jgi:1,4-dihydroxy-2-naphthoyl-CoA hydrolase
MDVAAVAPFAGLLGIEVASAEAEEVRGTLAWAEERCTAGGILHGGALLGFAATLGAVCAFLNLPQAEGATTATVESKTNFFRAVREGSTVTGVARPLHVGRSFIVVQTDLTDDDGRRVAQVTQTQAVLTGGGS